LELSDVDQTYSLDVLILEECNIQVVFYFQSFNIVFMNHVEMEPLVTKQMSEKDMSAYATSSMVDLNVTLVISELSIYGYI
jgi:hypothetical protein